MSTITFAVVAGLLTTVITAVINRSNWSSKVKTYVALVTALVLTIAGVFFQLFPDRWETVAAGIAAVFGVAQAVYPVLKPILKKLEVATTGSSQVSDAIDDAWKSATDALTEAPAEEWGYDESEIINTQPSIGKHDIVIEETRADL